MPTDKELLFSNLMQPHWDKFVYEVVRLITDERKIPPQIFISYAWPNRNYAGFLLEQDIQIWLSTLCEHLASLNIKVWFDINSMSLGTNIDAFMKNSVEKSDKILVIGTPTYHTRSQESNTNVAQEVAHIRDKISLQGTDCVVPILYRGEFSNAIPMLQGNTQILGTDCRDAFRYYHNLPSIIESLLELKTHADYQKIKKTYIDILQETEVHGLTDTKIDQFIQQASAQSHLALQMRQEFIDFTIEKIFFAHPDYQARPAGTMPLSFQALNTLQNRYQQYAKIPAVFGRAMTLEAQYINLQMLYQTKEIAVPTSEKSHETHSKIRDTRMTSFDDIFSQKQPVSIAELFLPASKILKGNHQTTELDSDKPPRLLLIQGRAGIGKTTFTHFVTHEWSLGRLWPEYDWVFTLRFRDLRQVKFEEAHKQQQTWLISDWIYETHFAGQLEQAEFKKIWDWLIQPKLQDKVLFILDGYDEAPEQHPCQQAVHDLLHSQTTLIVTSRPYGLSDLPQHRRELEVVGFVDENVEKYIQLYFGASQEGKAKKIISVLKTNPALWGNAHIPITLNIICGVLEKVQNIDAIMVQLETMAGLYEQMELALLTHAYRHHPDKAIEHQAQLRYLDETRTKALLIDDIYKNIRHYLATLALEAFAEQQLIISPERLNQVLSKVGILPPHISHKIYELLSLGLLKPVLGETGTDPIGYEFLHLTFQEYYAGQALSQKILHASHEHDPALSNMHLIKFNPRYQIVFWFTAGLLNKHPAAFDRLMKIINTNKNDDMIGHVKLGLQLRCTHEAWEAAQQTGWLEKIAKAMQDKIKIFYQATQTEFVKTRYNGIAHVPPSWSTLLKLSPRWLRADGPLTLLPNETSRDKMMQWVYFIQWLGLTRSPTFVTLLLDLAGSESRRKRSAAARGIGCLDPIDVTPAILNRLVGLLQDKYPIEGDALVSIAQLGSITVTSETLAILARLLQGAYPRQVCEAIMDLGTAAATPEIFNALALHVCSKDRSNAYFASYAVSQICTSPATITSEILSDLISTIRDTQYPLFATNAAHTKVLASTYLLTDNDGGESDDSERITFIPRLIAPNVSPELLKDLVSALQNQDLYIQWSALTVLQLLGIAGATVTPNVLTALKTLLKNTPYGDHLLYRIAETIGLLAGSAINIPEIPLSLVPLLEDTIPKTRHNAITSIGKFGAAAITLEIVPALLGMLQQNDEWSRHHAAEAIIKISTTVITTAEIIAQIKAFCAICTLNSIHATPSILENLTYFLLDKKHGTRNCPVDIVAVIKEIVSNAEISSSLVTFTAEHRYSINYRACNIIGDLGTAATSEIFSTLWKAILRDGGEDTRNALLRFSEFGAAAATPEILTNIVDLLLQKEKNKYIIPNTISVLTQLAASYLKNQRDFLNPHFKKTCLALLIGCYFGGNISGNIDWQVEHAAYVWQGFTDKIAFSLQLTLVQASWLAYIAPKVIEAIEQQKWQTLAQLLEYPSANIPALTIPVTQSTTTAVTGSNMISPVYGQSSASNSASSSSTQIAEGIDCRDLTITLNFARLTASKKTAVLTLMERYAQNCQAKNITRNAEQNITGLTFDHAQHLNDLKQELTNLSKKDCKIM